MSGAPILDVRGAVIAYGPDRPAVDQVDLVAACGRITALLGPSGSGKSTLLRAIAGLEPLAGGSIRFAEELWSGEGVHRPPEQRRCGVVFQDYALFPHLNALDNVAFGLSALPRPERRAKALAQLDGVELGHRASAFPHELSGGEQQRVALARALATEPNVMLLDEPFSGLDRRLRGALRETTAAALRASGAATVIVTHDAEEALGLADTIALMDGGRILQTGAPEDLYLKPNSLKAARLLGDVETFEAEISKGAAQTPLGPLAAQDFDEGARVHVLIRPEGVRINADRRQGAPAAIVERRVSAGHTRLTCRLSDDRLIQARGALTDTLLPGDTVKLWVNAAYAHIVTADQG